MVNIELNQSPALTDSSAIQYPFEDFSGPGILEDIPIHFAHANGYPPSAYSPLLRHLGANYKVLAMRMRPLWPLSNPDDISDWQPFSGDLEAFFIQLGLTSLIGIGHSLGGTATLRLSLQSPYRFRALVLLDPVIFKPSICRVWDLVYRLNLSSLLHPLTKSALKRRSHFSSRSEMFTNYRSKSIFSGLSDESLQAYVDSLANVSSDGQIELSYPPAWEARIYSTAARADLDIWKNLHRLVPPLLILRGSDSNTFLHQTGELIKKRLPSARVIAIPNSTHLLPLEKPQIVQDLILDFLQNTL